MVSMSGQSLPPAREAHTLADLSLPAGLVGDNPVSAAARLARDGLLVIQGVIPRSLVDAAKSHVERELLSKRREGDPTWFGAVYGYEDTGKRWDLKLELALEVAAALSPLLETIEGVIRRSCDERNAPDWQLTELAAMCTAPGDPGQPVHADTSHLVAYHAVTAFVALHDIDELRGPTRMYPRTHIDGELHMGLRTANEKESILCTMSAGDCVLMDSRLLHCGTANKSDGMRCLLYTSWMPAGRGDTTSGSTDTLLDCYVGRLPLHQWRDWLASPPRVEPPKRGCPAAGASAPSKRRRVAPASGLGDAESGALSPQLEAFAKWLRGHGVDLAASGLTLRPSPKGGLGAFALQRIQPGEGLARIPAAALLHAGKVPPTAFGQLVLRTLDRHPISAGVVAVSPEELLWLYLIWGRSEPDACPWYGYLQVLPATNPLSWYEDEAALRLLAGTPLAEFASRQLTVQHRRQSEVVGALSAADPAAFPAERFSFSAWMWARGCYMSRSFRHQAFPDGFLVPGWESALLLPLVDMLNHTHTAQVEWRFSEEVAELILPISAEEYLPGDELFNLYGPSLGNEELLSNYGFAIRGNPHDVVEEVVKQQQQSHKVVFRIPSSLVARRLADLTAANITGVERAAAVDLAGEVAAGVRLSNGLRAKPLETPPELLRAASLLVNGRDYDEESAGCREKRAACLAVARALRAMVRQMTGLVDVSRQATRTRRHDAEAPEQNGSSIAAASLRLGHVGRSLQRRYRRLLREGRFAEVSPDARSAAIYVASRRRILRQAAAMAQAEAEMAELAMRMDARGEDASDGAEDAEDGEEAGGGDGC